MRTHELMRRLVRNTSSRELDTAPVEVLAELLDCANEALAEAFSLMPPEASTVPQTVSIEGPTQIDVSPTYGTKDIGATYPEWEGCAIQMPGSPIVNRLWTEDSLELPHDGSSVPGSATVWRDAIRLPGASRVLIEDLWFETSTGHGSTLTRWRQPQPIWRALDDPPGTPLWFGTRGTGFTDTETRSDPGWYLHLSPRPSVAGVLSYKIELASIIVSLSDFQANRILPIPQSAAAHILRMAEANVAGTRLFVGDPELRRSVVGLAAGARQALQRVTQTAMTTVPARLGTPAGW